MATVTSDVPDPLKAEFERAERKHRGREAIASILERRARMVPVNPADVQAARDELRK